MPEIASPNSNTTRDGTVSDGVLSLPGAMLAHNADPAVRAAWLQDMFLPPDVLEWALNVVVVRSGGRTILIDTGMGAEFPDLPRSGRMAQRLEAADIDIASVTDVVLTHMHMDHVGGLLVDGVRGRLRPDLRIHLAAAEAEFWASPDFSRVSMPPGFPDALRSTAKRFLNAYHSQLRPFEAEHEVAPGVVVHRTGGHTPGHSVVRLASGGDRLTFAGDAVFAVGFDHPEWYNGFEHDPEEAARVPVRLPCGGRRRRLSLGTGLLGLLTACWVRAESGPDVLVLSFSASDPERTSAGSQSRGAVSSCRDLWRTIGLVGPEASPHLDSERFRESFDSQGLLQYPDCKKSARFLQPRPPKPTPRFTTIQVCPKDLASGLRQADPAVNWPKAARDGPRTPDVRHEAARVHHAAWRRGGGVATGSARAAASDAGDRVHEHTVAGGFRVPACRIPPRFGRGRLCRRPKCCD